MSGSIQGTPTRTMEHTNTTDRTDEEERPSTAGRVDDE
jgi:hypothetical protein